MEAAVQRAFEARFASKQDQREDNENKANFIQKVMKVSEQRKSIFETITRIEVALTVRKMQRKQETPKKILKEVDLTTGTKATVQKSQLLMKILQRKQ